MKFFTKVPFTSDIRMKCSDLFLLSGSCFTENIGTIMQKLGLRVEFNPHGILFNPLSVALSIENVIKKVAHNQDDILNYNGISFSWMHHTSVHAENENELVKRIDKEKNQFLLNLSNANYMIISWGTAFYYRLKESGRVVANCHKQPAALFNKIFAQPHEIVDSYIRLVQNVLEVNPGLRIILTISPVRHIRDGFVENQQSKAALILAAKSLCEAFPETISYFPAFEIVMDELRDYRFYAEDMIHPGEVAVKYIWERYVEGYFDEYQREILKEAEDIARMKNHRIVFSGSENAIKFEDQKQKMIADFKARNPTFRL